MTTTTQTRPTIRGELIGPKQPVGTVGLVLGLAASMTGVVSPVSALPLRPWYILVVVAAVVALLATINRRGRGVSRGRIRVLDLAFLLYVAVGLFVEAVNGFELRYPPDFVTYVEPVCWFIAYLAARAMCQNMRAAVTFLRAFAVPVFLVVPLGIAQVLNLGNVNALTVDVVSSAGFSARIDDDRLLRAVGLVGHWTGFGAYLSVIFTVAVALLIVARRFGLGSERYAAFVMALSAIGMVTTLTFSPAIVAAGVLLVSVRRAGLNIGLFAVSAVVAGVGSIVLGGLVQQRLDQQMAAGAGLVEWVPDWMPSTIRYRIGIWAFQTLPMIEQRPLTGWGTGVYASSQAVSSSSRQYPSLIIWPSAESQWLGSAMTGGVLLLVALVLLIAAGLVVAWRARNVPEVGWLAFPLAWTILLTVFFASTAPMFTNRGLPVPLWVLVGCVVGLVEAGRPRRGSAADSALDRGDEADPAAPLAGPAQRVSRGRKR